MKKRIIMLVVITACLMFLLALGANAAATNEFGTVDTSTTIDLSGMSTDTKARVVLFDGTEYHTYPAQYIVTSATDIGFNFAKINEAFSKSYANDSVIRIEIPNTVKVIVSGLFNYGKNNNLKEVYFPSDSQVYKFNWGCFEQNTGLEKINIPASLTEYHGSNHFAKCSSLKYVTFDEGYNVSTIPNNFFQSCSSLEELVFPNSVTQIGGGAFSTCSKLKKIVFGANVQTMLPSSSDSATGGVTWYLPATFYGADVETEPESNMLHHEGKNNNGVSGNQHGPKNVTFVYTGTYEEAVALRARCKAADLKNGENCVGLKRIYDAVLCTEAEYFELTGKKVGEGSDGSYFVYGYSACEAFYKGVHTVDTEKSNACVELCTNCQKITIKHTATENMSISITYADFDKLGTKTTKCLNEGCTLNTTPSVEEAPALFVCLGYSAPMDGEMGIAIGFTINNE
ncbi:MAG: leucine-rich repeat domain-containing protein, partial [Clostridia bacterium]|nr:leucine-rich repeat domain-containing protein [Clostridia bacterium]